MIAVTGATGAIGGRVARALARQGLEQRLLVRRPEAAPEFGEVVHFDYAAPDPAALDGVETLLMVSGAETADRVDQHRAVIDAAVRAGVGHVVYTSFAGAAPDCTFTLGRDHFATEQAIRESGLGFTFLRDNFYSDVFPFFVGDDGVIRGPAGEGRVAVVTRDDVAAGAVVVLLAPEAHAGRTWDLTGPSALTRWTWICPVSRSAASGPAEAVTRMSSPPASSTARTCNSPPVSAFSPAISTRAPSTSVIRSSVPSGRRAGTPGKRSSQIRSSSTTAVLVAPVARSTVR